jgi:hypothetical protein
VDLLQIIIELIVKALSPPKTRLPPGSSPDAVARQIQARIEAARVQGAQAQSRRASPSGFRQNKGQLAPQLRQATPLFRQRKTKRKTPPALPPAVVIAPAAKVVAAPRAAVTAPKTPTPVYVDARVLARWLVPQTLRAQFVLTEIFQPPVSLRDSHLS